MKKIRFGTFASLIMLALAVCGFSQLQASAQRNSVLSSAALMPTPAADATCENFLAGYIDWLKQNPKNGTNKVRVALASNQPNRVVSFAEGDLTLTESPFPSKAGQPQPTGPYTMSGTVRQYFSDRRFSLESSGKGGGLDLNQGPNPFAPQKTDRLSVSIKNTGEITLTLNSWRDTQVKIISVQCPFGLMHGFTSTAPQSMYVISLTKEFVPSPVTLR